MTGAQFPGHVYNGDAEPLTAEAPILNAGMVESYPFVAALAAEEPDEDAEIDAALVWALRPGTKFTDVPAAWVSHAVHLLNEGGAVLLLAHDSGSERGVRAGLLDALELGDMPAHRMGRA